MPLDPSTEKGRKVKPLTFFAMMDLGYSNAASRPK